MRRDAVWSALEAAAGALFSTVTAFVIARIIGPAELGAGAAAVAVNVVLRVAVNALFADALVQIPHLNDRILSSAFWASSMVGGLACLLQGAAGVGLRAMIGDPRLPAMGLVLAAPLPLVGAAGALQGLLTRKRAYRSLALRTLVGQGAGTLVGIAVGLGGGGAWALVCQQSVAAALGALTLLGSGGWWPARCLEPAAVRSLLKVGLPLTASTLLLIARYRLFAVLIGATAGPAVLGQVHLAFRLVDTVRELVFTALWRLTLPAMAEQQHDRAALLAQVDRWVRRCAAVVLPLCLAMGFGLSQLVPLLMGPRWQEAGRAGAPLLALMAWSALTFPAGVALVILGKARLTACANLISLLVACVGVLLFPPTGSLAAAGLWTASQLAIGPYVLWSAARALGVGWLRPVTGGIRLPAC